ncbi:MAG: hypothetical protein CMJ39_07595 [Phycisphaerae bacterium]|nr:hypothetical protein [Phycisphaerae bacterium]|tara:strand:- start:65 stop:583 length:519 start_codon:yes stop_codon:yes gene_type:complete
MKRPSSGAAQSQVRLYGLIDPGWLFIVIGLAVLASGLLLPSWREKLELRSQLTHADLVESQMKNRMMKSTSMLDDLSQGDDSVISRVSMSDRNMLQPGDEPVIRDLEAPSEVLQWLDASIHQQETRGAAVVASMVPRSQLEQLATGPWRLWFLGAGAMCLCLGLVLGPSRQK